MIHFHFALSFCFCCIVAVVIGDKQRESVHICTRTSMGHEHIYLKFNILKIVCFVVVNVVVFFSNNFFVVSCLFHI